MFFVLLAFNYLVIIKLSSVCQQAVAAIHRTKYLATMANIKKINL